MTNLEKLYQSIANLKELGLPLHEETLKAVDNLEEELKGAKVLVEPMPGGENLTIAFIEEEGIALELMYFEK